MISKSVQFVIPAGGLGSRFANFGYTVPKPLIPIFGIPMLAWVIGNLHIQKGDRVVVVTRPELEIEEGIRDYVSNFPVKIEFVYLDGVTDGPAITVSKAFPALDPKLPLIVANSDQYIPDGLSRYVQLVRSEPNKVGDILTMEASSNKWSYVGRDRDGKITKVVEKEEISSEATVGVYAWSTAQLFEDSLTDMIKRNLRVNNEFYVAPTYNWLINEGVEVRTLNIGPVSDSVFGLGTVEDLELFLEHPKVAQFRNEICNQLRYVG